VCRRGERCSKEPWAKSLKCKLEFRVSSRRLKSHISRSSLYTHIPLNGHVVAWSILALRHICYNKRGAGKRFPSGIGGRNNRTYTYLAEFCKPKVEASRLPRSRVVVALLNTFFPQVSRNLQIALLRGRVKEVSVGLAEVRTERTLNFASTSTSLSTWASPPDLSTCKFLQTPTVYPSPAPQTPGFLPRLRQVVRVDPHFQPCLLAWLS
jgi:hypothetical protein